MIDVPTAPKGDDPELRRQVIRDLVERGPDGRGRPRSLARYREPRLRPTKKKETA